MRKENERTQLLWRTLIQAQSHFCYSNYFTNKECSLIHQVLFLCFLVKHMVYGCQGIPMLQAVELFESEGHEPPSEQELMDLRTNTLAHVRQKPLRSQLFLPLRRAEDHGAKAVHALGAEEQE